MSEALSAAHAHEALLLEFFHENPRAAIAFSGGVDSAYLLAAAVAAGAQVTAYYVKSAFQPQFELDDAERLARELGADLRFLSADVLSVPEIAANPADRCYYCKKLIFEAILSASVCDGFPLLCDGTNASDDIGDRPGFRALQELSVRSPLRESGLTKPEIRALSAERGLFTWDKPAYACLATRIPAGTRITAESLARTEWAENYLFALGFRDFRVRTLGNAARLQLREKQLPLLIARRAEILSTLGTRYSDIMLDLEVRK